jgi:endonuclease-3
MRQRSFDFGEAVILPYIRRRLRAVFGPQHDEQRFDPMSQLIYGLIAWQTHDDVSMAAFLELRRRCSSWNVLLNVTPRQIERVIATVNHADLKARNLPIALRMARARGAGDALDLEFLADLEVEVAMRWLLDLHGVGAKIAATVLNFSTLRKAVLPVDTHLLRVGERLGLLRPGAKSEEGHDGYARLLPEDWDADTVYELHWLIKRLSQQICRPTAPACGHCPLRDMCPAANRSAAA